MYNLNYVLAILMLIFTLSLTAMSKRTLKEKSCIIEQGAEEIYTEGAAKNVRFSSGKKGILLTNSALVENDSFGAGLKRKGQSSERISGKIWAKKNLYLKNTQASQAWIAFMARRGNGDIPLYIELNGHSLKCPPMKSNAKNWSYSKFSKCKNSVSGYLVGGLGWFYVPFPRNWLKQGLNEIIFRTKDKPGEWNLAFADYKNFYKGTEGEITKFPYTSFRSCDGGKTWSKKLGSKRLVEGEYTVRICLKRYRSSGRIISPIVDLVGEYAKAQFIKEKADIKNVRLTWNKKTPTGTDISFYVRSGKTPFYKKKCWQKWKKYIEGDNIFQANRYLQWKAVLTSDAPLQTPLIINSRIYADVNIIQSPFSGNVWQVDFHNEVIKRSAFPYEYESYDNPVLKELRKKFDLDSVVAGCNTEFEKILKIMHWAHYVPQGSDYVPNPGSDLTWNSLDYCILKRTADGEIAMDRYKKRCKPIICTVANLTLFQALLSLGIPARHVNIGGHEVCEVWSNDYKKWVHLDANWDYYFYDELTGLPLNILDMHNVYLKKADWRSVSAMNATPSQKALIKEKEKQQPEKLFSVNEWLGNNPYSFDKNHYLNYRVAYFRIILRNNFLSKRYPLPLNQGCGWMPWPWDGYLNWEDEHTPSLRHYSRYTNRPQDMYPSLNQVAYTLEYGVEKGDIEVSLDSFTPNFRRFLVKVDNGKWENTSSFFTWSLHTGLNSLQVCSENSLGNRGIVSYVMLNYVDQTSCLEDNSDD